MAQKKTIELEIKTGKSEANLQDVVDAIKSLNKEVTSTSEQTNDGLKGIENQSKSTFKAVKTIGKGIKGLGLALKAAGFSLIMKAADAFFEVLKTNQPVADAMAVGFEFLSQILNQVSSALIDTYNAVSKSSENFDALGKVVMGLLNLAFTPLKLAFYGIKLGLQQAQLAWEDSFFGGKDQDKIKQLRKDIILTKNDLYGVVDAAVESGKSIYENVVEAAGELVNIGTLAVKNLSKVSVTAALENSKVIIQLRKDAELAKIANQGLIEDYDRQAEQLRQIRDNETLTIAERIEANNKLAGVLKEQRIKMLENADIMVKLARLDVQKNNSIENQAALQEALNEKKAIEAQITGFQSEQQSNANALNREALELNQSLIDGKTERAIKEKQFGAEQIQDDIARLTQLKLVLDEEARLEEERLINKRNQYKEGTQAFVDANNELLNFQQDNAHKQIQLDRDLLVAKTQLTQSQADASAKRAISEQQFLAEQIEGEYLRLEALKNAANQEVIIEEERLTNKRNQYKEGTQAFVDANNELLAFQQQNAQDQIKIDRDLNLAKQQLVTDALGNLASIVGENSKFGKGIALVQAIRDTYAGANLALASAPPPFNFVSAAAVIAGGLANVKAITATKEPTLPSFARGAGGGEASVSVPTPSSFATGVGGGGASVSVPPPPSFTRETKGDGASVLVPTLPSFATRVGGGSVSAPIPSTPPSFNVVGTSGTNQLADVIAGQSKQPIKAYVVSSDVSTAQSLDRNIIEGASI